ncbi:hypothetical protein, partial [Salmonella sp. SAL4435]|uniref:hypothetical protein n=1 Tax=Salmonella sp. SAL4435 TaxID=3159890 RepID=UPI003979A8EF
MNETGRLSRVVLKHARDAFVDQETIASQWQDLRYTAPPDLERATAEYDHFMALIQSSGAQIDLLPHDVRTTLDSV